MSSQSILFKYAGQGIYDYTNVYDPDVDGTDVAASGKVVPSIRSIVFDNRTSDLKVFIVTAVDPVTFKVSLMDWPAALLDKESMILNYGNDIFMLYYDNRTTPTRLTVDSKMILFGSNIASFKLRKDDVVISYTLQQSASGSSYAVGAGSVVEITDKYVDGIRRCNSCYTTSVLTDGDLVTLELYDSIGVCIGEVELLAKKSTILNSLSAALNPITGFEATCNQMDGDVWFLYKDQAKQNLSIYPTLQFADGTSLVVPVDNGACYLYGLADVSTNIAGKQFPLIVKYYINNRYPVDPSLNVVAGNKRVLAAQHTLKIIEKPIGYISKLSIVPVWNNTTNAYELRFLAYSENRNGVDVVTSRLVEQNATTNLCQFKTGILQSGSFNPQLFGTKQTFGIRFIASEINDYSSYYDQVFSIILKNPATVPTSGTGRDEWQIIDPNNIEVVYGVDDGVFNKPVIKWDATAEKHFIDTDEFSDKDAFVDTFYRLAAPPALNAIGEVDAPYPTHFRIRDLSGNVLTGTYEVTNYNQGFLINTLVGTPVTAGTVILEFLYRVGGAEAAIIYGVPVQIQAADGEYVVV